MLKCHCQGMTLIELMLTLASSIFIFLSLAALYFTAQKNYALQNSLLIIEENANLAIINFQKNFQLAGNIGSAKLTENFPITVFGSYNLNIHNKISGDDHSVTFRGASIDAAGLVEKMVVPNIIRTTIKPRFLIGDIAVIANYQHAEIFQIAEATDLKNGNQFIRATAPLANFYDETASVSLLVNNKLYVKKTTYGNSALYLANLGNRNFELVEDIKHLQMTYDVMQDQHLQTLRAAQITDWSKVVGIHIDMLVYHYPLEKHWNIYLA